MQPALSPQPLSYFMECFKEFQPANPCNEPCGSCCEVMELVPKCWIFVASQLLLIELENMFVLLSFLYIDEIG